MKKKLYFLATVILLMSIYINAQSRELHSSNLIDTTKPVIVHTPIQAVPYYNWPYYISTNVTDNSGIDSVWVRWYKNNPSVINRQVKLINVMGSYYNGYFNSTNSEVVAGDSIFYRIIAQDGSENHNKDSTTLYKFPITNPFLHCIGNGTIPMGSSSGPFNTYWWGNRTQLLYSASEIAASGGVAGRIEKIGFNVSVVGGQPMNGLNVRLQHTTQTSITGFVNTGWTTCYTGTYTIQGIGWQYIDLTPYCFYYNGVSNLLIEICFGNTSYTTATTVLGTTMSGMEFTEYHDLSTACSYTGFTNGTMQTARANICLQINNVYGIQNNNNKIPDKFSLSQNYPNPFNPVTRIDFDIPRHGGSSTGTVFVNLKVYDVLGREVQTLVNEEKVAGSYSVDFNGSELTNGVYFYKLEADGFSDVKRMVLIK